MILLLKDIQKPVQDIVLALCDSDRAQISDGYHTFDELYEFRKAYNAALFNTWSYQGLYEVHKSKRHHDGKLCFEDDNGIKPIEGWFIVVAILPTGQISNHYSMKDWDLFKITETEKALYEYDGHTPNDVLKRLLQYSNH